jgi:hypothetical protein
MSQFTSHMKIEYQLHSIRKENPSENSSFTAETIRLAIYCDVVLQRLSSWMMLCWLMTMIFYKQSQPTSYKILVYNSNVYSQKKVHNSNVDAIAI